MGVVTLQALTSNHKSNEHLDGAGEGIRTLSDSLEGCVLSQENTRIVQTKTLEGVAPRLELTLGFRPRDGIEPYI